MLPQIISAKGPAIGPTKGPRKRLQTWLTISATVLLAILALLSLRAGHLSAQDLPAVFPATIGRIEGDDLEVVTTTPTGVEKNAAPTVVAGGSEITLHSGHALLSLNSGGDISVCGPAHFKVLVSGGAVTLALDYGRVHPSLDSVETFTIYTPTIIATPIAISGGRRDLTLGLEQNGEMCVLTTSGAMRVEPQFSDQSLLIPQGGTANLLGGQIASLGAGAGDCSCDFPRAGLVPSLAEISVLNHPQQPEQMKKDDSVQPPTQEEPVYTVIMPTLSFNANSPVPPPDPDPETILLVREVRLRPSAIFSGHVNAAPAQAVSATPAAPAPQAHTQTPPAEPQPGLLDRMRNFFRNFTGRGPCMGAGCTS